MFPAPPPARATEMSQVKEESKNQNLCQEEAALKRQARFGVRRRAYGMNTEIGASKVVWVVLRKLGVEVLSEACSPHVAHSPFDDLGKLPLLLVLSALQRRVFRAGSAMTLRELAAPHRTKLYTANPELRETKSNTHLECAVAHIVAVVIPHHCDKRCLILQELLHDGVALALGAVLEAALHYIACKLVAT